LSVLRHGFDLDAAAAVADADLPLLAGLVDHSLVVAGEDGRYSMHELLRQIAAERLAADPVAQRLTRQRHADHLAAILAAQARAGAPTAAGPDVEAENLRAATEWILADADPATVDAHLVRLWKVYRRSGRFREAQSFLGAALARDGGTTLQRARWHRMLGESHQQLGEAQPARHHLEQTLQLLGHRVPVSTSGWLRVLAVQTVRRSLRSVRPTAPGPLGDLSSEAHERASAGFAINEVYWVLGEHLLMLPTSLRALNEAEQTTDVDLAVRARAGVAMTVGTIGLRRLADRELRASDAAFEPGRDPLTACWVAMLGGLHRSGVGDWQAVETGAARALELQRDAPTHRLADQVLLIAGLARYLTSRYSEAATAAAEATAAGRDRRDPVVQFWGLVVLIETALRACPDDPEIATWSAEATLLLPRVARVDAARLHAVAARVHLAAGRAAEAWDAVRTADRLVGPRPAFEPYTLEAHAVVPEICLDLLEAHGAQPGATAGIDPVELRSTADAGRRRLDGYARTFPMARPRALVCSGRAAWLDDRTRAARRAWSQAVQEAWQLRMPYELARAHDELGRHLAGGRRSHLGLDAAGHLEQALAGYMAAGCPADAERVKSLLT
jgi:tetratricopeptide (TPR) repeat protein